MTKLWTTVAVLIALATPALAAEYDPATREGSVSKNEMRDLFGNAVLDPEAAETVVFTDVQTSVYRTECRKLGVIPRRVKTFTGRRTIIVTLDSFVEVNPENKVQSWELDGAASIEIRGRFCPDGWRRVAKPVLVSEGPHRLRAEFEGDVRPLQF